MDKKTVSHDGTSIAYRRRGRGGPAVVLVSGAMSTGSTVAPLAARLEDRCTTIVYDRRGRGESGDTLPFAKEREFEDIAALIDAAAGGEAALYGISSGGALALEAAASGLPVTHVAVYEAPYAMGEPAAAGGEGTGGKGIGSEGAGMSRTEYTERLTAALAEGRRGDAVELFLSLTGLAPEMIAGARQSPMWAGMEAIAHTLAYDDAAMNSGRVPVDRLASITAPVLAVAGGASPAWMHDAARAIAAAAPKGTYRNLPDQNHMVEPQVLAPVLAEFFTEGQ